MFGQAMYVLPETVQANISRQHYHGAPGLWEYARGVLVETSRALRGMPLAVFSRVEADDSERTTAVVITAVARAENNDVVTVVWRQEYHGDEQESGWLLTVNGVVPHDQGTGRVRPAPPFLADIVFRAVNG
jgi:hypothetical protein